MPSVVPTDTHLLYWGIRCHWLTSVEQAYRLVAVPSKITDCGRPFAPGRARVWAIIAESATKMRDFTPLSASPVLTPARSKEGAL
jgi:hypothetical protein